MNKLFKILVLFLILLSSCSKNKKHLHSINKKLTFNVGFHVKKFTRKIIRFNIKNKDYVAFSDFATNKEISVNSIDGKQLFAVPVQKAINNGRVRLTAFDVINLDTFALLAHNSNRVYFINKKGDILYKKDYSNYLLKGINLYPPFTIRGNVLKAGIIWSPTKDSVSDREWNHNSNLFYRLFVDSSFKSANKTVSLQLDALYSRFVNDHQEALEFSNTLPFGKNTLAWSFYVDSIYKFNRQYQIDTVVKITSNYLNINYKAPTEKYIDHHDDAFSRSFSTHSKIRGVKYNKFNKLLYVWVEGPKDKNDIADFSILLYNKNFKKLDEILLKGQKFVDQMFVTQKGLYIRNRDDSLKTATFTLFRYE